MNQRGVNRHSESLRPKLVMKMGKQVGFIGIGIMGKGMLKNLVTKMPSEMIFLVWNRSKNSIQELQSQFPGRYALLRNVLP